MTCVTGGKACAGAEHAYDTSSGTVPEAGSIENDGVAATVAIEASTSSVNTAIRFITITG